MKVDHKYLPFTCLLLVLFVCSCVSVKKYKQLNIAMEDGRKELVLHNAALSMSLDSLRTSKKELEDAFTFLSNGLTLLEVQSYMDDKEREQRADQQKADLNMSTLKNLRDQLPGLGLKEVFIHDGGIVIRVPVPDLHAVIDHKLSAFAEQALENIGAAFKGKKEYRILLSTHANPSNYSNGHLARDVERHAAQALADYFVVMGVNKGRLSLDESGSLPPVDNTAGRNQCWLEIQALPTLFPVLASPESVKIEEGYFQNGDEWKKTKVAFLLTDGEKNILLGTELGNESLYKVKPKIWYSPDYQQSPVIFKMRTGDHWVAYSLTLGKVYTIVWNNARQHWDIKECEVGEQ